MASEDWLGPQFAGQPDFNPAQSDAYRGTAYSFARTDPETGQTVRNSGKMANMLGKNTAADSEARVPTGSTTDFQSHGSGKFWGFKPNYPGNASGGWN